jgi:hypothetical protein
MHELPKVPDIGNRQRKQDCRAEDNPASNLLDASKGDSL